MKIYLTKFRLIFFLFQKTGYVRIMSAKAINEVTGKNLLNNCMEGGAHVEIRFVSVDQATNYDKLAQQKPWLLTEVSPCTNLEFCI